MSSSDDRLDPDAYASEGGRLVDRNAARILERYPVAHVERTRDTIQIDIRTSRDPERGVSIVVTPEAYELRLPTIEWTAGAYGPAPSTRYLKRVKVDNVSDKALAELIETAIARRDAEIIPCRYCSQPTPPEHRHGRACHGCAERQIGIVH